MHRPLIKIDGLSNVTQIKTHLLKKIQILYMKKKSHQLCVDHQNVNTS